MSIEAPIVSIQPVPQPKTTPLLEALKAEKAAVKEKPVMKKKVTIRSHDAARKDDAAKKGGRAADESTASPIQSSKAAARHAFSLQVPAKILANPVASSVLSTAAPAAMALALILLKPNLNRASSHTKNRSSVALRTCEGKGHLALVFLQIFIYILREYLGTLSAATIKDYLDVIFQLLEELDAGGHPLTAYYHALCDIMIPPSLLNKLLSVIGTNFNSTSNSGLVQESQRAHFPPITLAKARWSRTKNGAILFSTVRGRIEANAEFSGTPDCSISANLAFYQIVLCIPALDTSIKYPAAYVSSFISVYQLESQ
ncbi:hypothetical protein GYMLUDRAFT_243537 [Collybiopsis luxurians FD-317 M1]|uniref:Uncharacterized protein n=1 Tax=Collybiopsis luxurians FD-317 M1 TaxID=944289 RepID=A0A0D0BZL0_9AGAR|nr:hypothetical protein GYMLUDRAFT_243537 [Collybiopsis luxurians FD-317 M1]